VALPQEFLMELKFKNDVESVVSPYVALKRRGRNLVGLCPFHNEKTGSFVVYPENGSYYCFGCGKGGDIITFTMEVENLDYIDAVRRLADRAGLKVPDGNTDDKTIRLKNDVYEVNREAARYFHSYLMSPNGKAGLDYLLSRGLTLKTIKHFGLGFSPNGWHDLENHLKSKGYSEYIIKSADLIAEKQKDNKIFKYDRFINRVMFPIINIQGKVVGFSGRALPGNDKQGGKYVNTADTPVYKKSHQVYGLNFAKKVCSNQAILVEGNLDVIALHQAGFENAVAALGTAFTEEQAKLIGRYAKEVVVTLDADEAGAKATDRAMNILKSAGVDARILRLPDCKDPDEFLKKYGSARFEALLDGAISNIEYRLYTAAMGVDLGASDGKLQYLKKACDVLAELDDRLAVDLYAGKLSEKYGVSKEVLINDTLEKIAKRKKQREQKQLENIITPRLQKDSINPQKSQFRRAAAAEETIICVLIKHPDLLQLVEEITPDSIITDFNRRLYEKVLQIIHSGHEFDLVLLSGDFAPDEIGYITGLLAKGIGNENPEKVLNDSIKVLTEENLSVKGLNVTELPDDEWAAAMKNLQNKKKI
jgi:DNA primase